jgi:hypothetical protein
MKTTIFGLIFLIIFNIDIYADSNQNNVFIDSEKICGFWSLDENTIDTEKNLRRICYMITKEGSSDIYNNYIGQIRLYIGGGSDRYDILEIENNNQNEYILYLGITYGGSGDGSILHIAYGKIRLNFIDLNTIYFEVIEHDPKGGFITSFVGKDTLCYRAIVNNDLEEQNETIPEPYKATHFVTENNVPLYHDRVGETWIIKYLSLNDEVQVIKFGSLSTRLVVEHQLVTRDGITAPLIYVKTPNEETGFCFSIFLEKIE